MITDFADPICSLPEFVAFNASARVEDVMPAQADEMARIGCRRIFEWLTTTKKEVEVWATRSEIALWRDRNVDFQAIGQ